MNRKMHQVFGSEPFWEVRYVPPDCKTWGIYRGTFPTKRAAEEFADRCDRWQEEHHPNVAKAHMEATDEWPRRDHPRRR